MLGWVMVVVMEEVAGEKDEAGELLGTVLATAYITRAFFARLPTSPENC
jgi:hypothetical protein